MNRATLPVLLAIASLAGCATEVQRERRIFDARFSWAERSVFVVDMSPEDVCYQASNAALGRTSRCLSVFWLFASHIRPGFSSRQMHDAIPDAGWLDECSLERFGGVGGQVDIDLSSGDAFCLRLWPDEKGWSEWVIDLTLKGGERGSLDIDDARSFLKGTPANKGVRLAEFNLWYNAEHEHGDVVISERFTSKGVGVPVR